MEISVLFAFAESKASAVADFSKMSRVDCIAVLALLNRPLLFQERNNLFYFTTVVLFSEWQFLESERTSSGVSVFLVFSFPLYFEIEIF